MSPSVLVYAKNPCETQGFFKSVFVQQMPIQVEVTHNPRVSSTSDCVLKQRDVSALR